LRWPGSVGKKHVAHKQEQQRAEREPVEPAVIEISVGKATVHIRGAVDARTLAAVLKALKVLK
jgi:hypothetical protein